MFNEAPSGYYFTTRYYQQIGQWFPTLVSEADKSAFCLTNRSFEAVDYFLGYLPSQILGKMLSRANNCAKIVDVAGGYQSKLAIDLVDFSKQYHKGSLEVVNVDLMVFDDQDGQLTVIQGNAFELTKHIPKRSVDFLLNYQLLPFLSGLNKKQILHEMMEVLAPGGIALIDDGGFLSSNLPPDRRATVYEGNHEILVASRFSNVHPQDLKTYDVTTFLIVGRKPLDEETFSTAEIIPFRSEIITG